MNYQRRKTFAALLLFFTILFGGTGMAAWGMETSEHIVKTAGAGQSQIALNRTNMVMAPATAKVLKLKGVSASKVKWSSSKPKVATVNSSGKVIARTKGTAVIQAVYGTVKYKCNVKVTYAVSSMMGTMLYKDTGGNFGYTGRWFKKSIAGGKYYFTNTGGSAVYFKVCGSAYVNVDFVTNTIKTPYFSYSVDGGTMKRCSVSQTRINVGNEKTHYVRLVVDALSWEDLWGEAGVGIKSIKPASGSGVVTAVLPQNPVVAFYGDSITEGGRALGMALSASSTSATHSFAWYCAEQLDFVPYFIGYGSTGILAAGDCGSCYQAIVSFSKTRKAAAFDADVIVIEHGTNDVNINASDFVREYRRILTKLHSSHKNAYIMAMIPMNQNNAKEIREAASGLKYCTVVETKSWKVSYMDGLHPNVKGAKTMGKNLAKKIAAKRKSVLK